MSAQGDARLNTDPPDSVARLTRLELLVGTIAARLGVSNADLAPGRPLPIAPHGAHQPSNMRDQQGPGGAAAVAHEAPPGPTQANASQPADLTPEVALMVYKCNLKIWHDCRTSEICNYMRSAMIAGTQEWFAVDPHTVDQDFLNHVHRHMEQNGFPAAAAPEPPSPSRPSPSAPTRAPPNPHTTGPIRPDSSSHNPNQENFASGIRFGPCPVFANNGDISVREWLRVMEQQAIARGVGAQPSSITTSTTTEQSKALACIQWACTYLKAGAVTQRWHAEVTALQREGTYLTTWDVFASHFARVFGAPDPDMDARNAIHSPQGDRTIHDWADLLYDKWSELELLGKPMDAASQLYVLKQYMDPDLYDKIVLSQPSRRYTQAREILEAAKHYANMVRDTYPHKCQKPNS